MKKKKVRFLKRHWEPKTGDSDELGITYEVSESGTPGALPQHGVSKTKYISINISRTLQTMWALEGPPLEKVLAEYARLNVADKLGTGSLSDTERVVLSSSNAPPHAPFDPDSLDDARLAEFEVPVEGPPPSDEVAYATSLASEIIDLRDNINALFGEQYEHRLLTIAQERSLFELSYACESREHFSYRVSSLCGLAVSIETRALDPIVNLPTGTKSIDKLAEFLRLTWPNVDTSGIADTLSQLNRLRRMYPIHSDRTGGVIEAFRHFHISFPVSDYQDAWVKLLTAYAHALRSILELLTRHP